MNDKETRLWCEYHAALFPTWGEWRAKQTPQAAAINLSVTAKAFARVELEDARNASDRMLSGEVKRPYIADDHVSTIVQAASDIACERRATAPQPRYVGNDKTFACKFCLDSGWVECIGEYKVGGVKTWHKYAMVCSCAAGDVHTGRPWGSVKARPDSSVPRFNPATNKPVSVEVESEDMPNYEPAFG